MRGKKLERGAWGMGHTRALLNLYSKAVIYIERAV